MRFALPLERERSRARRGGPSVRPQPRDAPPGLDALDGAARERFERLRAHRAGVARSRGIPAYIVAHDRTLIEMARRIPRSHAELREVFGMGPARIELYGDGFLEALLGDD
jgi:ATP-dependent DNA helicase RecQ